MTDQKTQPQENGSQASEQSVAIHSMYLKDVSFESPNAPAIFGQMQHQPPQIQINLGVNTGSVGEDTHEVVLAVTATAKVGDKTAFLVEVHQAGIFTLRGFGEDQLGPMLGVYCPNMLFPYAREAVSNLVTKGGFPPLLLEPVNFEALYSGHMQQPTEA
jgi:preprotein translocase subunit SecB